MYTIEEISNEIIINKSRFITTLIPVDNEIDAKNKINIIKKKYSDATHNTYAYIIDNIKRFSDDNEPSSTAGMPILKTLEKNNLNHVLCIVTRYFGGIKLGANGLIRAYGNSANEAIKKTIKKELINGYKVQITFNYNEEKIINNIINNCNIINKEYSDFITYTLECTNELDNLSKYNLIIIDKVIIKK